MKHTLKVFSVERTLMNNALDLQKRSDKGYRGRMFGMVQRKVNRDDIELDGMEMELVAIACRQMGRLLYANRKKGKSDMYFDLAKWIMNEKNDLNKKAAASKATA